MPDKRNPVVLVKYFCLIFKAYLPSFQKYVLTNNIKEIKIQRFSHKNNYWFLVLHVYLYGKVYVLGSMYHSPSSSHAEFLRFFEDV